jgi:subtilase family serine protease
LAVGASSAVATSLTIPTTTPFGTYYVCALADSGNTVTESNETNNSLCTGPTIQVSGPDLVLTAVTPNASTVNQGGTLSTTDTAKNQGLITAGAFKVGYSLSLNTTYGDGDDVVITTTRSVTLLAAGGTNTATTSLTIPTTTPVGNYHVCAKSDSLAQVIETDETNNTLCSASTVSLSPPDLIISAISTTATTVAKGANFSLSNSAKNQGGGSAGSFVIAFHLSTNTTYGDGDDVAFTATRTVSSLAAGATSATSTTLTVPASTPAGTYYVCALADSNNTVAEGDETNNSACTGTTITVPPPDLIISAISTTATTVAQGANFILSNSAKNIGGSPAGSFVVAFHLSTNSTYGDGDDIAFTATRTVSSLAAAATSTASSSLAVSAATPPGTYYVCALADSNNTVVEGDETNNSACTGTTITVPLPDLIISAISTTATTVAHGASFSLVNSAKNVGGSVAGSFVIAFHLSTNTTYGDGDDVTITQTRTVTSLGIGVISAASTILTVPLSTPSGTYYVCALTDSNNTVAEGDETNNSACTGTTIIVPPPDLIISAISTTATTVAKGANFSLSNTVKNQGGESAGSFVIAFHLSTNTTYGDGDDVTITQIRTVTSLGIGAISTAGTTLTVPLSTPSGTYFACALTDSNNTVAEGDETNNSGCTGTTITVP